MKRKNETFFYDPYSQKTHPGFWDCECKDNYIHGKEYIRCFDCGAESKNQPDSILREVHERLQKGLIY